MKSLTRRRFYQILFIIGVSSIIIRTGLYFASLNKTTRPTQIDLVRSIKADNGEMKQGELDIITMAGERNDMRLALVDHICKMLQNTTVTGMIGRIRMDPKHDVTLCRVNKAASSYTISMLQTIFNISEAQMFDISGEVKSSPREETRKIIDNSYLFKFVREPYGRLFSTYSNKFYLPKRNWAPVAPAIVKRCRENPSKDSLVYGHNITFYEMIRFTVEEFEAGKVLDHHISPMNTLCNPCDFKYDFIGKVETIVSDWTYLKHEWYRRKHIKVPSDAGEKNSGHFGETNQMKTTFNIIKDSTTISKYNLYVRAWSYYKMAGYIYKYIKMPYEKNSGIELVDFQRALEEAEVLSKPYAEETKQQKTEALRQAYATIPLPLLERLRKVVALDCLLYDYDNKPEWLFNRKNDQQGYDYFPGLE